MYTPTKATSSSSGVGSPVLPSPNGKGVMRGEAVCLCALCNCGKHRCPPRPADPLKFNGSSTYRSDFLEWPACPVHGATIPHKDFERLPFNAQSTYAHDFVPHQLQAPPAPVSPPKPVATLPFRGETEAHAQYREFNVAPSDIRWEGPKPTPSKHEKLPFNATTTFRHDFQPWDVKPEPVPAMQAPKLPHIPFNGETEAHAQYRPWDLGEPNKPAPALPYHPRPDDRDFLSEANKQYTEKHLEKCPVESLPQAPTPSNQPSAWEGAHVLYNQHEHRFA